MQMCAIKPMLALWNVHVNHVSSLWFMLVKLLLWGRLFDTLPPQIGKPTSSNCAPVLVTTLYWAPWSVGLHLEVRVHLCLPPRRLSISFLHKVNKRYFEIPVHSGVASQKRKAGIYFKKWKWFGGSRHISSLVPFTTPGTQEQGLGRV